MKDEGNGLWGARQQMNLQYYAAYCRQTQPCVSGSSIWRGATSASPTSSLAMPCLDQLIGVIKSRIYIYLTFAGGGLSHSPMSLVLEPACGHIERTSTLCHTRSVEIVPLCSWLA